LIASEVETIPANLAAAGVHEYFQTPPKRGLQP